MAERRGQDTEAGARRSTSFGWRGGLLLGLGVLVVVYLIAAFTIWLAPLRDAVEHAPITIAVLVVGTVLVLATVMRGRRPR